jgi:hypothetical protein
MFLNIKLDKLALLYGYTYKFRRRDDAAGAIPPNLFDVLQKINHDHKNHHGERGGNRYQHKRMHGDIQFEPAAFSMLGGGIVLYRSDHVLCIEA